MAPRNIQPLLHQLNNLFQEPQQLTWILSHPKSCFHISSDECATESLSPFSKIEIERLLQQMLYNGIRHNTSCFSSPILLVKKKYGNSHFCVDFRALTYHHSGQISHPHYQSTFR